MYFEKFNEARNDAANMVFGGACDEHLSEAIKCKAIFEKEIEKLKGARLPFFGNSDLKSQIKKLIFHSEKNISQMSIAIASVDRSFIESVMIKWYMDTENNK